MAAATGGRLVNEVWGLQGTAYIVVGLRYYARVSKTGWKSLSWDDGLMFMSTLVYTAESVMAYMVVIYWQGFANNGMTDAQRAALDPNSTEHYLRVSGSMTHVAGLLLYATLLWLLKGCWVVYYARLTQGVASRYRMVKIGAIMMPATYIACVLVAVFKCVPFEKQWQIYPDPGNNCMPAVSVLQTVFVTVMNTVTDLFLMMIPIPMIWGAQLPLRKKFSIILLFSGGFVELVFGLMRCISILTLGDTDPAQSGFWSVRESFVSFVVTNLPFIYPLIKTYYERSRSSANKSGNVTKEGRSSGKPGYRLDSLPGKRGEHRDLDDLDGGSQEHIVQQHEEYHTKHGHPAAITTTTTTTTTGTTGTKRASNEDASSQDSVTLANFDRDLPSPGFGVSRSTAFAHASSAPSHAQAPMGSAATAYSQVQVSSAAGTAGRGSVAGDAKGIMVTRRIEVSGT